MRLYNEAMERLYINDEERSRFLACAREFEPETRTLCEVYVYTGCRASEAIALCPALIQLERGLIGFKTLKKRKFHVREVPVPMRLCELLDNVHGVRSSQGDPNERMRPLWQVKGVRISRTTAYRRVKQVMNKAGIIGARASPKGLRHGFGTHNTQRNIPQHSIQKYLGHSSIETTAIYTTLVSDDEYEMMARTW